MKLHHKHLFILLLIFSCKNENTNLLSYDINGKPIITEKFKLDFIYEVLNDTSQVNFKSYENPYIFIKSIEENNWPTNSEKLPFHLKSNNTEFIRNQIMNRLQNQNLIDYGFKSINQDKLINYNSKNTDVGIEYLVSEDSILKVEKLLRSDGILYLSTPIFNEHLNLAYIEAEHGPTGEHLVFEKKNNKWLTRTILSQWIK